MVRFLVPTQQNTMLASKVRGNDAWGPVPGQAPTAGLHCEKVPFPLHLPPRSLSRAITVPVVVAFVPLQPGIVVSSQHL